MTETEGLWGSQAICQAAEAGPHHAIVKAMHNAGAVLWGWHLWVGECRRRDEMTDSSNVDESSS